MSIQKEDKLNRLLKEWPKNAIYLVRTLKEKGYSDQLLARYKKSNWIRSIGRGAYAKQEDQITLEGGLYALQAHAGLSVHQGGRNALSLLGKTHYIEMTHKRIDLFGGPNEHLPAWFKNQKWNQKRIKFHRTSFLPFDIGLAFVEQKGLNIKVSTGARSIMECLYLAPKDQDLLECLEIMEGLNNLRPTHVQDLLEQCRSVKVKRLFLYFAEKLNHEWFNYIDLEKVDLGSGKRSIVNGGVYDPKYKITIPAKIEQYGR